MTATAKRKMTREEVRALRDRRAVKAQELVAKAVLCDLCPHITPEEGIKILQKTSGGDRQAPTAGQVQRAAEVVGADGWMEKFSSWLDEYWAAHGHGPTWKYTWHKAPLWPEGCTEKTKRAVFKLLGERRAIDGARTPFGLKIRRDGPA